MNIARGLFRFWVLASAAWVLMWLAGYLGLIGSPFPVSLYYPWPEAWDWMTVKPLPERYVYVPKDAPKPKGTESGKDPNGLGGLTWADGEYDRTIPTDNSIEIHHLEDAESVTPQDGFQAVEPHRELELWLPTGLGPQERQKVLDTFSEQYVLMYEQSYLKWNLILLGTVFIPPVVVLLIGMAVLWAISGFKAAKR